VADVIAKGKDVTYDLRADRDPSKAATTSGMTDAIIAAMRPERPRSRTAWGEFITRCHANGIGFDPGY
jgi:hypothetical protein